jgi:hypothetical protein
MTSIRTSRPLPTLTFPRTWTLHLIVGTHRDQDGKRNQLAQLNV